MIWVIETNLNDACEAVAAAAKEAGHRVIRWSFGQRIPNVDNSIFLGSLTECPNMPGCQGNPELLRVSSWMPIAAHLALNQDLAFTTAGEVKPSTVLWSQVFVRPDSAMKPFSGRVLNREDLCPEALDIGFYYKDPNLSVVIAEAVSLEQEWRYVAVNGQLIAHSGYLADNRTALMCTPPEQATRVAQAALDVSPEPTVVIDICKTSNGDFRLVEYNLFSGADLYACDAKAIVQAFDR